MKKLILSFWVTCTVFSGYAQSAITSSAQDTLAYCYSGNLVKDHNLFTLIDFSDEQHFLDQSGHVISSYTKLTGRVVDMNGDLLLSVNDDGYVFGVSGNQIGWVDSEGRVYDVNGGVLGSGPVSNSLLLVYYFFVYKTR